MMIKALHPAWLLQFKVFEIMRSNKKMKLWNCDIGDVCARNVVDDELNKELSRWKRVRHYCRIILVEKVDAYILFRCPVSFQFYLLSCRLHYYHPSLRDAQQLVHAVVVGRRTTIANKKKKNTDWNSPKAATKSNPQNLVQSEYRIFLVGIFTESVRMLFTLSPSDSISSRTSSTISTSSSSSFLFKSRFGSTVCAESSLWWWLLTTSSSCSMTTVSQRCEPIRSMHSRRVLIDFINLTSFSPNSSRNDIDAAATAVGIGVTLFLWLPRIGICSLWIICSGWSPPCSHSAGVSAKHPITFTTNKLITKRLAVVRRPGVTQNAPRAKTFTAADNNWRPPMI